MKEHPILFSGEMVRAILEGRKTQTRRVVKPLPSWQVHSVCKPDGAAYPWAVWFHYPETDRVGHLRECPYGKPGDRLWVREAHSLDGEYVFYREGHEESRSSGPRVDSRWRPSIHMPRWASRITLEITDVQVQRLQDISEEDARAEGADPVTEQVSSDPSIRYRAAFHSLWAGINGLESWDANPWVWALTFKQVTA